ncbi:MAG: hypothetical protein U0805_20320 [Pirellulales bacterium]
MAEVGSDVEREDDALQYRSLHTGALISLVLGIVSVFVVVSAASSFEWCLVAAPIPALGLFLGARSLARIRAFPDQYTGAPLAQAGMALSLIFLVGGIAYGGYVYATEVPDGYTRISFNEMKPDELQERSGVAIPPEIMALKGKKVFIKGYVRPGSSTTRTNIDRFLLVRDNNQCCFGDLSKVKYFDQMVVQITSDDRVDDNLDLLRMGGVLEIHPENLGLGPDAPVFGLKADYARN